MDFAILLVGARGDFRDEVEGGFETGVRLLKADVEQGNLARLEVQLHSGGDVDDRRNGDEAIASTGLHESGRLVGVLRPSLTMRRVLVARRLTQ